MPRRRKAALQHGKAKDTAVIWHYEHRSKKNRKKIHGARDSSLHKQKILRLKEQELEKENV